MPPALTPEEQLQLDIEAAAQLDRIALAEANSLAAEFTDQVNQAVLDGQITQAQADAILGDLHTQDENGNTLTSQEMRDQIADSQAQLDEEVAIGPTPEMGADIDFTNAHEQVQGNLDAGLITQAQADELNATLDAAELDYVMGGQSPDETQMTLDQITGVIAEMDGELGQVPMDTDPDTVGLLDPAGGTVAFGDPADGGGNGDDGGGFSTVDDVGGNDGGTDDIILD